MPLKSGGAHCFNCRGSKAAKYKCSYIRSALCFNTPSRALIHAFKYEKYIHIAKFFAPLMYKTFKENPPFFEAEALIPVPIHKSRLKKRSFNQAEVLAKHLSVYCGLPCEDILVRKRKTDSQTKLNRKQRQKNIADAFEIKKGAKIKGQHYLYPHAYKNHYVEQKYLPDEIKDRVYYNFGDNKTEQAAKAYRERIKKD